MSSNWTRQVFENLEQLRLIRTDFRTPNVLVYVKSEKSWYMLNSDPYTPEEKPPYIIKPINGVGSWRCANPLKPFVSQVQLKALNDIFADGSFLNYDWWSTLPNTSDTRPQDLHLDHNSIFKRLQRFSKSIFIFSSFEEHQEYFFTITNNSTLQNTYWKADDEVIKIHVISTQSLFKLLLFTYAYGGFIPRSFLPSYVHDFTSLISGSSKYRGFQENAFLEYLINSATQTITANFDDLFGVTPTKQNCILIFESVIVNPTQPSDKQRIFLPCVYNPEPSAPHSRGRFSVPPLSGLSTPNFIPPYNFGDGVIQYNNPWSAPLHIKMIEVPPGRFQRNNNAADVSVITQPFLISETLITRYQFATIMNDDPSHEGSIFDKSGVYFEDPLQNITWLQAAAFCIKLSLIEGLTPVYSIADEDMFPQNIFNESDKESFWLRLNNSKLEDLQHPLSIDMNANGYRLPTEMEYMWAMMGAPETGQGVNIDTSGRLKLFAGDNEGDVNDYTVNQTNSGPLNNNDTPRTTRPVKTKLPNELGLYDMSGNVFCFLQDIFQNSIPSGELIDFYNYPNNLPSGLPRVIKGGGFNSPTSELSLMFRASSSTLSISNNPSPTGRRAGFRVVRKSIN